ncbi:ferritin-like domain-containing protein [Phycicoccus sp. MAQZ13P-2]|uniref:DUF4439 domain-containing protein n=1 Tax=Phycicoccus mangrovi TaxID=2840470 RepID=UPI001C0082FB|nr:DUF4439 domain-containing protein [Phycicoccus mangrovi]MBT9254462.1 ferritin-like domain-containing protein [Phycicoccus mangrovi]MBT9272840.1 ferritin-like domain-containing protein [Phycicoccus mangrovi]
MPADDPRRPGRRLLLAGTGTVLLGALTGCGVRLEDDAPRLPLVPTRRPLPAQDLMTALVRDTAALAADASALGDDLGAALATAHRRQVTVLRTTLLRASVPAVDLDPSPSPSPSTTPSSSTDDARRLRSDLAARESAAAAAASSFAAAPAELLPTLAALHAQRVAAAALLGDPARPVGDPPAGTGPTDAVAALRRACYLLEVAAARSGGTRRERAVVTLGVLRTLRDDAARPGQPPPALGFPLPFTVRTGADVDRLVARATTDVRASLGAALPGLLASDAGTGLAAAARWLGAVEVEVHRWGGALVPFPGLT